MTATSMMRNTCRIRRKTPSQDTTTGAPTYTWVTTATDIACSIQQASGFEAVMQFRETGERSYNVYFPAETELKTTYRLVSLTGPSGLMEGTVLEVTSPPQDHAGRGAYLMVTAKEIKGPTP